MLLRRRRHNAAEAEMVAGGVLFAFAAGSDHIARAVLVGAKKRAAAMHALFLVGLGGIEGCVGTLGIAALRLRFAANCA